MKKTWKLLEESLNIIEKNLKQILENIVEHIIEESLNIREHGSLNVPIENHPTIRYMVYNGYFFRWCPIFPKWDSYQSLKKRGSSPRRRAKRGKRLGHPRTKVRTDEAERWTWRSFQWFRAMDKHK